MTSRLTNTMSTSPLPRVVSCSTVLFLSLLLYPSAPPSPPSLRPAVPPSHRPAVRPFHWSAVGRAGRPGGRAGGVTTVFLWSESRRISHHRDWCRDERPSFATHDSTLRRHSVEP